MLLHNQKSMYHMDDVEKTNLTDMVLVAINEITKFNPENTDGSSYDFGVDFTNISPFNPYMISDVLQDLGYEDVNLDTNGWDHDYWNSFIHPDVKKFPPMQLSGTGWIHECHLHGNEDDCGVYPHLEDDPEYADRIKHGLVLLEKAMNRAE